MCTVLDQENTTLSAAGGQLTEFHGHAIGVLYDHGTRRWTDLANRFPWIAVVGGGIDIVVNRSSSGVADCRRNDEAGESWDQDLIPLPDTRCSENRV